MKIASQGIILLASLFSLLQLAMAEVPEYTNIKSLLIQAIDDPEGKADGVLTGNIASFFRKETHSNLPLLVNVSTAGEFSQPGCKRLNLHFRQPGVKTTTGEKKDFDLAYGINFCKDGDAPQAGSSYRQLN